MSSRAAARHQTRRPAGLIGHLLMGCGEPLGAPAGAPARRAVETEPTWGPARPSGLPLRRRTR
jgi:hypothetical protein